MKRNQVETIAAQVRIKSWIKRYAPQDNAFKAGGKKIPDAYNFFPSTLIYH